jgi:polysaccharide export outer membrane protein
LKKFIAPLIVLFAALASCRTSQSLDYFTYPAYDSSHMFVYESFEVPIKLGDQLSIVLTSLKPEYAIPYMVPPGKNLTVDEDGNIQYPQLGTIKVVGLTRNQLRDLLTNKLKVYLIDPIVLVDFVNFKITVMGEVGRQGTISVPDGKINILEALAQSGDITQYGRKDAVVIIREKNGMREFGYVNLLSHNFFTTPYYRLQQNDIVYVRSENKPPVSEQALTRKISFASTILGAITTVTFLILTLTRN